MHTRTLLTLLLSLVAMGASMAQSPDAYPASYAQRPRFRALVAWNPHAESAHVDFARDAVEYFRKLSFGDGFLMDTTTRFHQYVDSLERYQVVVMLNTQPQGERERKAFEHYMDHGGGWLGFHAAAYNDKHTGWPWFNRFLGCGAFLCNNWPPQCAMVECDTNHVVTRTLPTEFVVPESEFYMWSPSPSDNPDVRVLLSISPRMYPFGIKDIVRWGDFPIVWTNTRYRMVYLNMGHGDTGFSSPTQNLLVTNALRWVVSLSPGGDPFEQ